MPSPPVLEIQPLLVQNEVDASEPCHQAGSLRLEVAPGTSAPALPARLIMIFDMSGSMRGRPMELLEAALSHVFTNLRPQDKLSMIRFGGDASVDFVEWDKATIESTGLNPFQWSVAEQIMTPQSIYHCQPFVGCQPQPTPKQITVLRNRFCF